MHPYLKTSALLLCCSACVNGKAPAPTGEPAPATRGPYAVGSTNMEIDSAHVELSDDEMHAFLLGLPDDEQQPRFIDDILKHPEAAWVTEVDVPQDPALYGPASGVTLPVVTFIAYPTGERAEPNRYDFPYFESQYGSFEDMLSPGEAPVFADPWARYPLILMAHGGSAHGLYDVEHAHDLASHGYIVAVLNYGDDRTGIAGSPNHHVSFLRPLITRAVLDSLLESEPFGRHIDGDRIGITGHSFGGFTALALTGGPVQGNRASVTDERIKASVIAAPWVGGRYDGNDVYAFGANNNSLKQITTPTIWFYGTADTVTEASFILPAAKKPSGPTYVVELVDQPHVFEGSSWVDRNNWERLFFCAYLKGNPDALATLRSTRSMPGGGNDVQHFDYQK